jgi:hypothetical protein
VPPSHQTWTRPLRSRCSTTAFDFSVINQHFDVADFLFEHGADINTNWDSNERASILHHLVFQEDYRLTVPRVLGDLREEGPHDGPVALRFSIKINPPIEGECCQNKDFL